MSTTIGVDALLDLWSRPWTPGPEAERAFGRCYADPVLINGAAVPLAALVDRAIALRAALADQDRELLTVLPGAGGVALEFRLTGRHVGPLSTGAGVLPATGRSITLRVIDILTVSGGLVTTVSMVADELTALSAVDAARLVERSVDELHRPAEVLR